MSEIRGSWESRAETGSAPEHSEAPPLVQEGPESSAEFYHQGQEADRPNVDRELGRSTLHGYEKMPSETTETDDPAEYHDIWDRRSETSGTTIARDTEVLATLLGDAVAWRLRRCQIAQAVHHAELDRGIALEIQKNVKAILATPGETTR
jgi:hypothetical protein